MNRFLIATVAVLLCVHSASAVDVKVDVNDIANNAPANTQLGFETVTLNDGGVGVAAKTLANGVTIDIDAAGFTFVDSDRRRATPVDGGGLTQAALYQDFIFAAQDTAAATATSRGLDVKLGNLATGLYEVTIHSFDSSSPNTRTSDWTVANSAFGVDNYQFNGNTLPTNDADNQFTFQAGVTASGALTIQGRQDAAATAPQVFLNAIQLTQTHAAGDVLAVDIDTTRLSGSNNSGPVQTEPGFVSLNVAGGSTGSVNVAGTTFTVFSADGSRIRTSGSSALTNDFIFDDGDGQAVGLRVFDLPEGLWQAEVFSSDIDFPAGDQIVGISQLGGTTAIDGNAIPNAEIIFTDSFASNPNTPFTFIFDTSQVADGFGIFTREVDTNRARFNGLRLTQLVEVVPEPTTALLGLMGLVGLASRRRRAA